MEEGRNGGLRRGKEEGRIEEGEGGGEDGGGKEWRRGGMEEGRKRKKRRGKRRRGGRSGDNGYSIHTLTSRLPAEYELFKHYCTDNILLCNNMCIISSPLPPPPSVHDT